jgi:hypothetical protein
MRVVSPLASRLPLDAGPSPACLDPRRFAAFRRTQVKRLHVLRSVSMLRLIASGRRRHGGTGRLRAGEVRRGMRGRMVGGRTEQMSTREDEDDRYVGGYPNKMRGQPELSGDAKLQRRGWLED